MKISKLFLFSCFLVSLFIFSVPITAEIKLPALFGDHMVLQRQTDAAIWGTASPNKTVNVTTSWDNQSYSTQSDAQGYWKLKVKTPSAGGPFQITLSDGQEMKLTDVLIGEVWIGSGQSNMQMPMKGYMNQPIYGANETIAVSRNEKIRLFTVERTKTLTPQDDFVGEWKECAPENVVEFSATAYFFGRMIQNQVAWVVIRYR